MPDQPPVVARPTTSGRDPRALGEQLGAWLSTRTGEPVTVSHVEIPESNGMSCETILLDAEWGGRTHELVAKIAPDPDAVPVFAEYDLPRQFAVMRTVRENSAVPVPEVLWCEPTFFVMRRLAGNVPPDVMPYNFGSWVTEATSEERQRLQDSSVKVLVDLHAIPTHHFDLPQGLSAHVEGQKAFYDWVCGDGLRSPLIERGFEWLRANWPTDPGPDVLCWGDARIGNIMYQDFTPVAVLDWEMAALGPCELDLGWFIYLHRFFEDIAAGFGLPALPDFLRRQEVSQTYERLSGYEVKALEFYLVYAALRHAIIMFRIQRRSVHFGEASVPDDPDHMIMHHESLRAMLDGHYWSRLSSEVP